MQEYLGEPIDLKPFKQTFVVCGAIVLIFPMLTFVLWVMLSDPVDAEVVPAFEIALFGGIAFVAAVLAPFVRGRMLKRTGPMKTNLGTEVEGAPAAWGRISQAAIVGFAMFEMPLLLGFVLAFLSMSWLFYLPFAAVALIGWAYMYPRPAQVRSWYARQMGYEHVPGMPL